MLLEIPLFIHDVTTAIVVYQTEHFMTLTKNDNTSAIADHVKTTEHNNKWDHLDILARGKTDYHCKIKETLFIQELEPAFNANA